MKYLIGLSIPFFLIVMTSTLHAESWDCEIKGIPKGHWVVQGTNLLGPSLSDLAPTPGIKLRLISNSAKALFAYNDNGNVDSTQIDLATISKPDGKFQLRLLNAQSNYQEHYEGECANLER